MPWEWAGGSGKPPVSRHLQEVGRGAELGPGGAAQVQKTLGDDSGCVQIKSRRGWPECQEPGEE